jgi:hypothetical protein
MWTKYFKVVKIRRGRVITPRHGEIDFSRNNIPVEICQQLYEEDFPYLEITEEGKKELYGIEPVAEFIEVPTSPNSVGDAPIIDPPVGEPVEPPIKRKYKKKSSN